jgi:FKBP-type peptidyl-prolyl cis-trans isomerase FkpA
MRKLIIFAFVILFSLPAWAVQPKTEDQKTLYALGVDLARKISFFYLSADEYEFVKQGMTDVAYGKKLEAEPGPYMENINNLLRSRMLATAQKQKDLAKPYLEKAAKENGAQKMPSGLIYQQIKAGTGSQPKASDVVKAHYTAFLIDGTEFENSIKEGKPRELPLAKVTACLKEGIGIMKVGGKAKLICPSDIAYGDQGIPPFIPGGATLIYEVDLLGVK